MPLKKYHVTLPSGDAEVFEVLATSAKEAIVKAKEDRANGFEAYVHVYGRRIEVELIED